MLLAQVPSRILRSGRRLATILFGREQGEESSRQELETSVLEDQAVVSTIAARTRSSRARGHGVQKASTVALPHVATVSRVRRSRRGVRVGSWKSKSKSSSSSTASGSRRRPASPPAKRSKAILAAPPSPSPGVDPVLAQEAHAPPKKRKRSQQNHDGNGLGSCSEDAAAENPEALIIEVLPDELLDGPVMDALGFKDLCSLSLVCRRFEVAVHQTSHRWSALFRERWGKPGRVTIEASKLAGGWSKLYKQKHLAEKASAPWIKPCDVEVQAMLNHLAQLRHKVTREISVTFLVDGSGSVTEDDFATMTDFMTKAVETVNRETAGRANFGVIQFSNEVKVELKLQKMRSEDFEHFASKMSRMNGGTNIALALTKACTVDQESNDGEGVQDPSILSLPSTPKVTIDGPQGAQVPVPHLVLMLTDGRVDSYQASAAAAAAEHLERMNIQLFTFAVGRSVDFDQLTNIVRASGSQDASRVMGLRTLDDPPW